MTNPGAPQSRLRPFDFVFVLRPATIVPLWIFFVAGTRLAAARSGVELPLLYPPRDVVLGLLSMTALLAGGYLLNQIRDIETDRRNKKLFFLPRGLISLRAAWTELAVLWLLAVLLAVPLAPEFGWALGAAFLLALTYSAPPVSAKARTPLDLIWNGLGFGAVAVVAGWATVAPLSGEVALPALSYTLAVAGITASTTIPDIPGDAALGLRTTGAVLGVGRTSLLGVVLLAAAALAGAIAKDLLGLFGPVVSLPLLLRAHRTGSRAHRVAANQIAVAVFGLIVGARAPYLLVLVAAVVLLSRAYYLARFGITYPGPGTP
jgi:4-hydroxybenzoate polyprenyltransferase